MDASAPHRIPRLEVADTPTTPLLTEYERNLAAAAAAAEEAGPR